MADARRTHLPGRAGRPRRSGAPLYLQLKSSIEEAVHPGVIGPGDALPSERDIAVKADVSRVTVRKAVQDLVKGGILVQRHGSGTFVAPRVERVEQSLSRLTSFTEDMARRGMTVRSEWLDRGLYPPSPDEMMVLGLSSERAGGAGQPPAHRRRHAARHRARVAVGDRAARSRRRSAPRSMRRWSRPATARCAPCSAFRRPISARPTLRLLGVPRRRRPASTSNASPIWRRGKVIEFTRSVYRGDAYDFVVELRLARAGRQERQADDRNPYAARDRRNPGCRGAPARSRRTARLPRPGRQFASSTRASSPRWRAARPTMPRPS